MPLPWIPRLRRSLTFGPCAPAITLGQHHARKARNQPPAGVTALESPERDLRRPIWPQPELRARQQPNLNRCVESYPHGVVARGYKIRAAPPLAIYLEPRHGGVLACPVVDSAPPLDPSDWRAPTEVRERRRAPRDRGEALGYARATYEVLRGLAMHNRGPV